MSTRNRMRDCVSGCEMSREINAPGKSMRPGASHTTLGQVETFSQGRSVSMMMNAAAPARSTRGNTGAGTSRWLT